MFVGVVHLNGMCGVCGVGVICVVHVWCVCLGRCVIGDSVLSVVFMVYM